MQTRHRKTLLAVSFLSLGLTQGGAAFASISDTGLSSGDFYQLNYGDTGTVYITPLLYISDFGNTTSLALQTKNTVLSPSTTISGLGTSVVNIQYTITNTGSDPILASFTNLRLMVNAQADGSGSYMDVPGVNWDTQLAGYPDKYQIRPYVDTSDNLISEIQSANTPLNGVNTCGSPCDIDMGLEWDKASMGPGDSWTVSFQLVDDPKLVSGGRYLSATSFDTANTALYFGNVQAVPEPESYAMLLVGLGLVGFAARRHQRS